MVVVIRIRRERRWYDKELSRVAWTARTRKLRIEDRASKKSREARVEIVREDNILQLIKRSNFKYELLGISFIRL